MTAQKALPAALQAILQQARQLHGAGNLAAAEGLYRQILGTHPNDFDTAHLLGVLSLQTRRLDEAEKYLSIAVRQNPGSAVACTNLGVALANARRFDEALARYDAAIRVQPNYADAHFNRGNVLRALQRNSEAAAAYATTVSLKNDHAAAFGNWGATLNDLGRHAEALAAFDKACALMPGNASFHSGRGRALASLGRPSDALAACDRALSLNNALAEAHWYRSACLAELSRYEDALSAIDGAIAAQPNFAEAHLYRANILYELNRSDDAIEVLNGMLAKWPDFVEARFALCFAELPTLYASEDEIVRRRVAYEQRLKALLDDASAGRQRGDISKAIATKQPFRLAYQGLNDRDLQAIYGTLVCDVMERHYGVAVPAVRRHGDRIKVGFASSFFCRHSNWKIPIKGWISQLDRNRFEIIGYHLAAMHDEETDIAKTYCEKFVDGISDPEQMRGKILSDVPDVLIYPGLFMDRLSAWFAAQRLAPVQCNSTGHPEPSGMRTVDYFLSSDLMEPDDAEDHYTEQLIRLPNLSIYYEPVEVTPAAVKRKDIGLRDDAAVFWCGQSLFKYLPRFDHVFADIAKRAGNCQFVFIRHERAQSVTDVFRRRLETAFRTAGLDFSEHCVFLPRLDRSQFAGAMGQSDIFLDSLGWSGFNSAMESLAHNLPIVTCPGTLMRARHSAAVLRMLGTTATIASSVDEYVELAAHLANNPAERRTHSQAIADNKHKAYRDRECIVALEAFLERTSRAHA